MILGIGSLADQTFRWTVSALRAAGYPVDIVDLAEIILNGAISGGLDDPMTMIVVVGKRRYRLADYSGWAIRLIDLAATAPDHTLADAARATNAALGRLARAAARHIPVVNPPPFDQSNFAKMLHIATYAAKPSWLVPESCLTNCIDTARAFVAEQPGGAIYKGASAAKTWVSLADVEAMGDRSDELATCPVLFQEYVEGADVRVHVVDDRCFAERLAGDAVDYRRLPLVDARAIDLPVDLERDCIALCREMGLPLAGIDFKISACSGQWFFLEANSMPCYQGYDKRADGQIGRAIAAFLSGKVTHKVCAAS